MATAIEDQDTAVLFHTSKEKMKPYTNSSHLELISCLVLSAEIIVCVNAFFDDLRNGTSVTLPLEAM